MADKALQPVEQKQVLFYDDEITAVRLAGGMIYIPVRPICNLLGLNWPPQYQRIQRDPVLSEAVKGIIVTITPSSTDGRGGGPQEMTCLPLDYLNGWLFGINASRVKSELRDKIIQYQRECYRVLAEAFRDGRLTTTPPQQPTPSPAGQAVEMLEAMLALARQQLALEQRVDGQDERLDTYETRLETLEAQLGAPDRSITPEQAMQISQAVKAVALVLSKRSGSNQYGSIYGELYRRFSITSYKLLPAAQFEEAMDWLNEWYQDLTGESPF